MKLLYLIVAYVAVFSVAIGEEIEEALFIEEVHDLSEEHVIKDPHLSHSHFYLKMGTSILYQDIGFGGRSRDLVLNRGNDFNVNIKGCLPAMIVYKQLVVFPMISVEYTSLFYKPHLVHADYYKYSGFGLEVSIVWDYIVGGIVNMVYARDVWKYGALVPILNPKIVWGKEYPSGSFSQWSLNLTPTALAVIGLGMMLAGSESSSTIGWAALLGGAGAMVEYSVGF